MKFNPRIIILFIIFIVSIPGVSAINLEITPEHPVVGDTITIKGSADANEPLDISINFEKTEKVAQENRQYKYVLDFENPLKSSFTVTAEKVEKLNIGVKILLWWTRSANADNFVATISQGNVPKGTYQIKIDGTAAPDQSSVLLKMKAASIIKADPQGKFEYSYSTKGLPEGNYNLNIEGITRSITILPMAEKPKKIESGREEFNKDQKGIGKIDDRSSEDPIDPKTSPEITETAKITQTDEPEHDRSDIETKRQTLLQRFIDLFRFW